MMPIGNQTDRVAVSASAARGELSGLSGEAPRSSGSAAGPGDQPSLAEIRELRQQLVSLQRIVSLGILAGGVFHELNNALTPILNYAKLALRNADPAYRERALARILEAGQRAAAITGGMLALARPGANPGRREPTDLHDLVRGVALLVEKDLARHRVRLELELSDRLFAKVNPAQIQQVLINLIINARQAMPDGGVLRLRLAADRSGRIAEVTVADQGVGIAPENLRRIFEPFFSTKNGPDSSGLGGTGLGLSVCRDIVEAHHGRIRVESRPGQGSTFTLMLPTCLPPTAEAPAKRGTEVTNPRE
jgi:signal transduction histidine kinase